MWKRAILVCAACLLLAGCGEKTDMASGTAVEQKPPVNDPYPVVEILVSPDGVYTAETHTCRTYVEVFVREKESGTEWQFALPDGSPIPEYTFLPEDWGEWLESNTLLLTVGRGGDAGEQHTYRCSLEMDDGNLTAASVLEQTVERLDTDYDFTHDGVADALELMTVLDPDTGDDLWYELWLKNGAGKRVWSYAMAAGGPSWDLLLFTVELDGQDYLLELATAMGQGYCSYFYEVFALGETGERVTRERGEVEFDVNFGSPIHESFDCAAIADFLWRVKALTAQADSILMDVDVTDGLRCLESPEIFEHHYHCGEFVALDSREEMETQIAYWSFLAGDTSLIAPEDAEKWGLGDWRDVILAHGELEYTCLDLDGDGGEELLVQWVESPESYNGVFHYKDGRLTCWQNDFSEGSCRDYPLQDGTMVRQYDFNGTTTYTLFRYRPDGTTKELTRLVAREGAVDPVSGEELAPTYEANGMAVDESNFEEWLYDRLTSRLPDRSIWTKI